MHFLKIETILLDLSSEVTLKQFYVRQKLFRHHHIHSEFSQLMKAPMLYISLTTSRSIVRSWKMLNYICALIHAFRNNPLH